MVISHPCAAITLAQLSADRAHRVLLEEPPDPSDVSQLRWNAQQVRNGTSLAYMDTTPAATRSALARLDAALDCYIAALRLAGLGTYSDTLLAATMAALWVSWVQLEDRLREWRQCL